MKANVTNNKRSVKKGYRSVTFTKLLTDQCNILYVSHHPIEINFNYNLKVKGVNFKMFPIYGLNKCNSAILKKYRNFIDLCRWYMESFNSL